MWRGAWDSYAPEYPCHAWWTIQQADSSSISSAYSRPPQGQNLIVINTSAPPEVPGVGFYPHNSIMTEPFPQPPSFVPPFLHALPALHVNNLPTAPLSSELHSTDNPIDQALNPDLTTYLDTATHHTVNIPNSATSGDLGQTEDVAPPFNSPSHLRYTMDRTMRVQIQEKRDQSQLHYPTSIQQHIRITLQHRLIQTKSKTVHTTQQLIFLSCLRLKPPTL